MFHFRRQKLTIIAQRLLRECTVAMTLIAMLIIDLPLTAFPPVIESAPAVPSCCAARLTSQTSSLSACGCSLEKRTSGTCCCQGQSTCGQKRGTDSVPALRSCDCSGSQSQLLLTGQPRLGQAIVSLFPSEIISDHKPSSITLCGLEKAQPENPPPELLNSVSCC